MTNAVQVLKNKLNSNSVQEQFQNALAEGAPLFVSSLIDIYTNDKSLQECEPNAVIMEALKAATLKLPINKSLGFAYVIPYKEKDKKTGKFLPKPQFQMGYRGYIQLAQRSGKYKHINADVVYEGELNKVDKVTGELDLSGEAKSEKVIGYFAYIESITGFRKAVYWPAERMMAHAKRYSKSFNKDSSPWKTNYDEMAIKTMLRHIISKYGEMSIEMIRAVSEDIYDRPAQDRAQQIIDENANRQIIDVEAEEEDEAPETDQGAEQKETTVEGPGF